MFNSGLTGYNVTRGLLGALKPRGPRPALVAELLEAGDFAACLARLRAIPFLHGVEFGREPADLERALFRECALLTGRLRKCLGGAAGRLLEAFGRRYELHDVKLIFRGVLSESTDVAPAPIHDTPVSSGGRRLSSLKSPAEVVAFYAGGGLGDIVSEAYELYHASGDDLSLFEVALDRSYIELVWNAGLALGPADGTRLRKEVLVPWLGSTAVLWVLWLARYREMGVEEIVMLLDVPEDLLARDLVARLVETRDASSIAEDMDNGKLSAFLAASDLPKEMIEFERFVRRFVWSLTVSGRVRIRFDISTLLATLMRWEFVVEDAITVAGGKAVGLEQAEIADLLATQAA